MTKKITLFALGILLMPLAVRAAENFLFDARLLPGSMESIFEFINLILALMAAVYAIKLAALSQGGEMEKTWNLIAWAAVAFAVLEIYGVLKAFYIIEIEGLGDVIETIFLLFLLTSVYRTRKTLLKKLFNK